MPTLHLDIETRSLLNLRKVGVYRYATHPSTDIITVAWALDDEPVRVSRVPTDGSGAPFSLHFALLDPKVRVCAHNAGFERVMLERLAGPRYGWPVPSLDRWDCTAARAARMALPRSLDNAAAAMKLVVRKDEAGHRRMMQMARPRRVEDDGTIVWWDDDARFAELLAYNKQDVEVERALDRVLDPLPPREMEIWRLTERMNDRGVPIDEDFVACAREAAQQAADNANARLHYLTGGAVSRVTDVGRIKRWIESRGVEVRGLAKADVADMLLWEGMPLDAREVLLTRQAAGKSSVAKLDAIVERMDDDGRVRGNLIYHGASTGRWAGTGVQLQNLPRPGKGDGDEAFYWDVVNAETTLLMAKYPDFFARLSRHLRGAVCAPEGHVLARADYSAVEARGVAWLAGATTLLEAFRSGADAYKVMASKIFHKPVEEINDDERFVGKQVVLGAGYGLGAKKFQAMCAGFGVEIPIGLAELAIGTYRRANPEIPALWRGLEQAAMTAVRSPGTITSYRSIRFQMRKDGFLLMRLPSHRHLYYAEAEIGLNRFGQDCLTFMAENPVTRKWEREDTWGGTLTENAVQAICRDLMATGLLEMEKAGYTPVLTVHDEGVAEIEEHRADPELVAATMCLLPEWAAGFPLTSEGKCERRYGK